MKALPALLLLHPLGARGAYWDDLRISFPARAIVAPDLVPPEGANGSFSIELAATRRLAVGRGRSPAPSATTTSLLEAT